MALHRDLDVGVVSLQKITETMGRCGVRREGDGEEPGHASHEVQQCGEENTQGHCRI